MASTKDIGLTKGRRALLFTVLTLALICGLGFAYLGMPAVDLNQYVTAGLWAPSQRPPVSKEEKPSQAPLLAPSFDIASVDERGTLVAAGRSEAGWTIQLKSKSRILGETKADDNNEWVLTPKHRFLRGSIPYRFLRSILQGSAVSRGSKRAG